MKKKFDQLLNSLFRILMRLFMPDLARQMEQEGLFSIDLSEGQATTPDFIRVEDRGADITIFAFSGLDVLYAGFARYEFQKVLHNLDVDANFVFVRDIHRIGFHLRPDGNPGGLEFYEKEIKKAMDQLGASRNIAIGSSIGGSAAFYFGTRCAMQQIVIFGAAFELDGFTAPRMALHTLFDMKKLFTEPRAYFELLIVTLSAIWGTRQLAKKFGRENVARPLDTFEQSTARPLVTLFYGATAWPDARQAQLLLDIDDSAQLIPLPTGRHNTPAFLKQHKQLTSALSQAIVV